MEDQSFYGLLYKFGNELKVVVYTAFIFLNIDINIVQILLVLMLADTIFGITRSLLAKEKFTFKRLWAGLISKVLVIMLPMVLALIGKGLEGYDFTPLVKIVLKLLIVAEGFSIITSLYVIKTKKKVEEVDIVSMFLLVLRKLLLSLVGSWIGQINTASATFNNQQEDLDITKDDEKDNKLDNVT